MHEYIGFDNNIVSPEQCVIAAVSAAALNGTGVFTTIAIYDGLPFLWEKHWWRLTGNSAKLAIDVSMHSEVGVRKSLSDLLEANAVTNGRARITFFDESASPFWTYATEKKTGLLITTADFRTRPENFKLGTSPFASNSSSPLAGIKSCNYLERILAFNEAKQRGFDEAVQLNDRGNITSACMANLFWLDAGKLYTPSLANGCIAGTTREFVMESWSCTEVEADMKAVEKADAIFLTSAGIGVVRVKSFNGRKLSQDAHPIVTLLPT